MRELEVTGRMGREMSETRGVKRRKPREGIRGIVVAIVSVVVVVVSVEGEVRRRGKKLSDVGEWTHIFGTHVDLFPRRICETPSASDFYQSLLFTILCFCSYLIMRQATSCKDSFPRYHGNHTSDNIYCASMLE